MATLTADQLVERRKRAKKLGLFAGVAANGSKPEIDTALQDIEDALNDTGTTAGAAKIKVYLAGAVTDPSGGNWTNGQLSILLAAHMVADAEGV